MFVSFTKQNQTSEAVTYLGFHFWDRGGGGGEMKVTLLLKKIGRLYG